jgi:hypothetical protein
LVQPVLVEQPGQGELFTLWRYHAVFTDSPLPMLQAETDHRQHAVIEGVHADLKNGPLAHLPSVIWSPRAGVRDVRDGG